jgi:hypothetical protein
LTFFEYTGPSRKATESKGRGAAGWNWNYLCISSKLLDKNLECRVDLAFTAFMLVFTPAIIWLFQAY